MEKGIKKFGKRQVLFAPHGGVNGTTARRLHAFLKRLSDGGLVDAKTSISGLRRPENFWQFKLRLSLDSTDIHALDVDNALDWALRVISGLNARNAFASMCCLEDFHQTLRCCLRSGNFWRDIFADIQLPFSAIVSLREQLAPLAHDNVEGCPVLGGICGRSSGRGEEGQCPFGANVWASDGPQIVGNRTVQPSATYITNNCDLCVILCAQS